MKLLYTSIISILAFSMSAQNFLENAKSVGISHTYNAINFGGGVSFYDFDDDGWDDLTIATAQGEKIQFYKNINGQFQLQSPFVSDTNEIKQILWVDIDNDGDNDLFAAVYDGENFWYENDGNFNFVARNIPNPKNKPQSNTFAATFSDIDIDGDLDLIVTHRGKLDSIPNQLLINDGSGTFSDVTANYFFDSIHQPTFCVVSFDYNEDGYPDIYTAEDRFFGQNQLYKNLGNLTFSNQTDSCNAGVWIDAMGLSIADYNFDGLMDMYISNGPAGNPLFHNNGDGTFTDTADFAGVAFNKIAWGNQFFDYNNDQNPDLHVCATLGSNGPDKNGLFLNLGNGTFADSSSAILDPDSTTSFSSAAGDYDNNGFPDLAINNVFPDSFHLWHNTGNTNNWLKLTLEGTVSNRDGIGAKIELFSGGVKRTHYTTCGTSFQGQNSQNQLFGIGQNAVIDTIIVIWPSGIVSKLHQVPGNQPLTIIEGLIVGNDISEIGTSLNAYPIPFQDRLNLTGLIPGQIKILNNLGQTVFQKAVRKNNEMINTSDWKTGIYYLHHTELSEVKKLIK
ncbi:MAG: FG-GAP-like repeat-containing protein [Flavobacteriales bacterium]|nr:FG-GAP-like repeat-containing protein [Flavobacteriales bacterium]